MPSWVKAAIDWIVGEGRVIFSAPVTFLLASVAIAWGCWKVSGIYYGREIRNKDGQIDNLNSLIKLKEASNQTLKYEAEGLKKALDKAQAVTGPKSIASVAYGNTAVRQAFDEISAHPVTIHNLVITHPGPSLSDGDAKKFAAYMRLIEAGLAKVETTENATVVSSTSTAADLTTMREYLKNLK